MEDPHENTCLHHLINYENIRVQSGKKIGSDEITILLLARNCELSGMKNNQPQTVCKISRIKSTKRLVVDATNMYKILKKFGADKLIEKN